jgi:hypothetical protein
MTLEWSSPVENIEFQQQIWGLTGFFTAPWYGDRARKNPMGGFFGARSRTVILTIFCSESKPFFENACQSHKTQMGSDGNLENLAVKSYDSSSQWPSTWLLPRSRSRICHVKAPRPSLSPLDSMVSWNHFGPPSAGMIQKQCTRNANSHIVGYIPVIPLTSMCMSKNTC